MNPTRPLTINLDRVLANAERSERQANVTGISVEPPPVFFSSEPAILVIFLGPPKFEQSEDSSLFFAANTNWDLLLDPAGVVVQLTQHIELADPARQHSGDGTLFSMAFGQRFLRAFRPEQLGQG